MKIVNLVELLRNIIWFLNWLFLMVKIVYRVWRKNMLLFCNGFIIGGINELVILVYSSNKFVIVFFRFLYKNIIV